jgi:hypothetical protein
VSIKALEARIVEAERKYETLRLAVLDWGNGIDTHSRLIDKLWQRVEALEAAQPHQDKLDRLIAIDRDDPAKDAAQQPLLFTAALAQPEPAEMTDEEIDEQTATLIPWLLEEAIQAADSDQPYAAGKLTLAAQLLGELRPTIQPEPVAPTPTDEELDELFTEIDQSGEALSWRAYARAVLARYGTAAIAAELEAQ